MDTFFQDLLINLQSYYDGFITLLPKAIIALIIFSIIYFISGRAQTLVTSRLNKRMDDPLLGRFLGRLVKAAGIIIAVLIALQILGLGEIATGIFAGASFSAVVVGFAFKDIGENFLAGFILAFNRPFRVGDTVELDGIKGVVVTLNIRNSQIKTFDGKDVFIPNANVIKNPVINYTIDGFLRQEFTVGLDYGSDADAAADLIVKTLDKINGILTKGREINVFTSDLNTSTLDLTVQYWLDTFDKTVSGVKVKSQAINSVLTALDDAGYYLPGNIMELKNYNKEEIKMKPNEKKEEKVA